MLKYNDTYKAIFTKTILITCLLTFMQGLAGDLAPALAEEEKKSYPRIDGELTIEFETDHTSADTAENDVSDTYNTTEAAVNAYLNSMISAHGTFVFEPVQDLQPGEDRIFSDHGLYAQELYAKFTFDPLSIVTGKFNPAFGQAWDITPGLYGADFAEDYELTERIGLGTSVDFEHTPLGKVTLTGAAYHTDTSVLSNSIFKRRGRTSEADGGISNTGELDSFAFALQGEDIPGLTGLKYNLGYRHQEAGITDLADETGYVGGLSGAHEFGILGFEWVGEVAYLENAAGVLEDTFYYTIGSKLTFNQKYSLSASYTGRDKDIAGADDVTDHLAQASFGMEVYKGWDMDLGYKYEEINNEDNHTVGLKFSKTIEFSTDPGSSEQSYKQ